MSEKQLSYSSPVKFTIKQRFSLAVLPPTLSISHRVICSSCQLEVTGFQAFDKLKRENGRVILAFWHEVLPLAMWTQRSTGYHTLTSYSYDGELAARIVRYFGLAALRGSSSRGGSQALRQLETALEMGITIGFTLDGPRGPRRVSKPGVAVLAARSQLPVVPLVLATERGWRMRSWDRMVVPKPLSRIHCVFGEPIAPPTDESKDEVERMRQVVEQDLNARHDALEKELGIDIGRVEPGLQGKGEE